MNLDELQSVQSKERQATSLQNLRPSFYQEVGEFVQELTIERDRAAERADDPFSSPEVQRLTNDLQTARQTVEALYERRVGKVVKMASIAAADMPTDDDGLTDEEARLFDALVARIQDNRDHVLDEVLDGDNSNLSAVREPATTEETEATSRESKASDTDASLNPGRRNGEVHDETDADSVDAAAMMGAESEDDAKKHSNQADENTSAETEVPPSKSPVETADTATSDPQSDTEEPKPEVVERTTVRITRDIGEIFGVDERTYDLSTDEVVTLPAANADPLVERDAAEKLE